MTYPQICEQCSSADVRYEYDRHEPVRIAIGTGQTVEMPAAGQQGVLQVTCSNCDAVAVHHVGWFDPPAGDERWTVRTVSAAPVGSESSAVPGESGATADQQDSPRYNDRGAGTA